MELDHGAPGVRTLLANVLSRLGILLPQTGVTFRLLHGGVLLDECLIVCGSDDAARAFSVLINHAGLFSSSDQPGANIQPFPSGLSLGTTLLPSTTLLPLLAWEKKTWPSERGGQEGHGHSLLWHQRGFVGNQLLKAW